MKIAILGLFLSVFPLLALAQSQSLFLEHPDEANQATFAARVDAAVAKQGAREQKIIGKIQDAVSNADKKQISSLMSERIYKGLRDNAQKAFWAEVLYIAFNYSSEVGCESRSFWFLSDGKKKVPVKQAACAKQVDQNLILGGITSKSLREKIAQDYCQGFNKTWPAYQDAAIAYNKGLDNPPYLCRR